MDTNGSILYSVKKQLGIMPDYEHFDPELILHINSIFLILAQLGVGPAYPFQITGPNEQWTDFISDDGIPLVKSYMGIRVRKLFDPPVSGSAMSAIDDQIDEFEWRMLVFAETPSFGKAGSNTISISKGTSLNIDLDVIDPDGNEISLGANDVVDVKVFNDYAGESIAFVGFVSYSDGSAKWHIRPIDTSSLAPRIYYWNAKAELANGDIIDLVSTSRFIIRN